jgi:uncharacterized protein (TIGR03435 family)
VRVPVLFFLGLAGASAVTSGVVDAQALPNVPASFEVASVRPNTSAARAWSLNPLPGGRFSAQNVPLRQILLFAYGMRDFQLVNDPAWTRSSRFDIDARVGVEVPLLRMRDLVKALLQERFSLVAHMETREMPIYALVVLRPDGALGPDLKRSTCPPSGASSAAKTAGNACGGVITDNGTTHGGGVPLAMLADSLSGALNTVVADKSGLSGYFDFTLRWADPGVASANAPLPVGDAPALTTALQEQLGLRLQPQRGPVDVLVVDRVSLPTGN